jgi:tetratricopeptide (TPR) repeat protein
MATLRRTNPGREPKGPSGEDAFAEAFDAATAALTEGRDDLGERGRGRLCAAADGYAAAADLAPDAPRRAEALSYSACALVEVARLLPTDEALPLLELAVSRFAKSAALDPAQIDSRRRAADALHHMGDRLRARDPRRAAEVYGQAVIYAREALAASAEPGEVAGSLDVLIAVEVMSYHAFAGLRDSEEARQALAGAVAAADRQRALGDVRWNAACAYSLAGLSELALEVLEVVVPRDQIDAARLEGDSDLARLRGHPRFVALLERARPDK